MENNIRTKTKKISEFSLEYSILKLIPYKWTIRDMNFCPIKRKYFMDKMFEKHFKEIFYCPNTVNYGGR
jgi:hypothetical protein